MRARCVGIMCGTALFVACTAARIEWAITRADELRGTEQYAAALRAYELLVAEHPTHPKIAEVLLRIGDLYGYTQKDFPQATAAYRRIIAEWPRQPAAIDAHRRLAEIAMAAEDYTGAIEYYEQLAQWYPDYAERDVVRHLIGAAYFKQGEYAQARIEWLSLLERTEVAPEVRASVLYDLAETYLIERKPEAAVSYYRRLAAELPAHPLAKQARMQLARCYGEAGKYAEAVGVVHGLRREFPDDPVVEALVKDVQRDRITIDRPGKLPWERKAP